MLGRATETTRLSRTVMNNATETIPSVQLRFVGLIWAVIAGLPCSWIDSRKPNLAVANNIWERFPPRRTLLRKATTASPAQTFPRGVQRTGFPSAPTVEPARNGQTDARMRAPNDE